MTNDEMRDHREYRYAVEHLQYWQNGGTSFACDFFHLLCKADTANRERFRAGFPFWVLGWEDWKAAPSGDEFFKQFSRR